MNNEQWTKYIGLIKKWLIFFNGGKNHKKLAKEAKSANKFLKKVLT